MKKWIFLCLLSLPVGLLGSNPLEFREYQQTVILQFATQEEAQKAQLSINPLPENYKLALSARWDDSSIEHLKTLAVMKKHNIKGTFFMNGVDWVLRKDPEYLQKLQSGGCSLGLHTLHHPQLPTKDSYSHFREYMQNRIMLETAAQAPVNSQVLPFCSWWEPVSEIPLSIGWGMRASGVISSPDVMFLSRNVSALGYPPGSHAYSRLLTPGDRVPNLDSFHQQLKAALADTVRLADNPSISMSMHSWHTPEGLQNLDRIFAELSGNPDWWYCNQSEYGAYRYEARNASIAKKVNGNNTQFTIQRIYPAELGVALPLYFTVQNASPISVIGAQIHGKTLKLPHNADRKLPEKFDRMDAFGNSTRFPEVKLQLRHPNANELTAHIENRGNTRLEECSLTFRFPAACSKETVRRDIPLVEPGKSVDVSVILPERRQEPYYRYGHPYYALQMDFRQNNRCNRLFSDLEEPAEPGLPITPDTTAMICMAPKNTDLAKLSNPSTVFNQKLSAAPYVKKLADVGPYSIKPEIDRKNWPMDCPYLAVLEFKPLKPGPVNLTSRIFERVQNSELWLNGKRIDKKNEYITVLNLLPGVNRLVVKSPCKNYITVKIEPAVEFLSISDLTTTGNIIKQANESQRP